MTTTASPTGALPSAFADSPARALVCRECRHEVPLSPVHVCDRCWAPLEVGYDLEKLQRVTRASIEAGPQSIWRYAGLLPAGQDEATRVSLGAGMTPLREAKNLAAALGMSKLWVKDDSANPTHSFKDRVVSVALSAARAFGYTTVSCASTGNLANSVAAHATQAGLRAVVFIPDDLEQGKVVQTAVYDQTLVAVQGTYDDVNRLCSEIAENEDWAFVNVNVRPYYAEGSKTLGYEVAEQLGWRIPPQVVIPMASGSLLTKVDKAFGELDRARARRRVAVEGLRRTGNRLLADRHRVRERLGRRQAREAVDDRAVAGHRQPGRRAVRPRRRPPHRRGDGPRVGPPGRGGHPPAGLDRGAVRRDRRRRHRRDAQAAARARARSTPTPRPSSTTPATG